MDLNPIHGPKKMEDFFGCMVYPPGNWHISYQKSLLKMMIFLFPFGGICLLFLEGVFAVMGHKSGGNCSVSSGPTDPGTFGLGKPGPTDRRRLAPISRPGGVGMLFHSPILTYQGDDLYVKFTEFPLCLNEIDSLYVFFKSGKIS